MLEGHLMNLHQSKTVTPINLRNNGYSRKSAFSFFIYSKFQLQLFFTFFKRKCVTDIFSLTESQYIV